MSLADEIIEGNKQTDKDGSTIEYDDLNMPMYRRPDYVAARILKRNYELHKLGEEGLLHMRGKYLYLGDEPVVEDRKTLGQLFCNGKMSIKPSWVYEIWYLIKQNVPELDTTKIVVDDRTYWDMNDGALHRVKQGGHLFDRCI